LQDGTVPPEVAQQSVGQVLKEYRRLEDHLRLAQQDEGIAWMWDDDYWAPREHGGVLLDLLGYIPSAEAIEVLRAALSYQDPWLKHFAATSLLRLGEEVSEEDILDIASSAETRNMLYEQLSALGHLDLYPEEFRTQAAFAEGDMVRWLTFPTELARVPDEIELMYVLGVDGGVLKGVLDYYLFRFRTFEPHWAAEDGWMAGVSGPYPRDAEPSPTSPGDTFSHFEPWDSKTPEEHLGEHLEYMVDLRQTQGDRP
jgi:hypothetical protein